MKGLKGINKTNNILIAYEPIWSIGTGIIPEKKDLEKNINFIKKKNQIEKIKSFIWRVS